MKQIILLTVMSLLCISIYGQTANIKTMDISHEDYYKSITYLNQNNYADHEKFYRLVIRTSEIYDSIIIETLTTGEEGGNIKILNKRSLDMDAFWDKFHLTGEISGLKFINWVNSNSFILKANGKSFLFKNIGLPSINISFSAKN